MPYAPLQPPTVPPFSTPSVEIDEVINQLDAVGLDQLSRLMREFRTTRGALKIALAQARQLELQINAYHNREAVQHLTGVDRLHNDLKVGDADGSTVP